MKPSGLFDQWSDFPAVQRALNAEGRHMTAGFGPLGQIMEEAAISGTDCSRRTSNSKPGRRASRSNLARMPQVAGQAAVAAQKLANEYNELAWQAAGATQQIYAAAAAMVYFHSVGG